MFEQEAADPAATSITLSSSAADAYFGAKHGVQPAGGPPPYDFGTDTEVFDAFGVPASWVNNIAGVGYDMDGVSGIAPPGSTVPEDGFIGLGFTLSLAPGASTTVTILHTYGQESPLGGDADLSIEKTNSAGAEAELGSLVDYTLEVTNDGPDFATGVEVTDDLPAEVTYVSDTCGGVNGPPWVWAIGDLDVDETVSCAITVSADVLGTAVNTADVTGDDNDPDPANNASTSTFEIVEGVNVLEIPTLGTLGFAALVLLLGGLGVRRLRRRA